MNIHAVPRPASHEAEPHPLLHGVHEVERLVDAELYGHNDSTESARARSVRLVPSDNSEAHTWVALADGVRPDDAAPGDVLGTGSVHLSLAEDLELASLYVAVRPDARGRGVARALLETITPELVSRGRTTWFTWVFAPGPAASGADALAARTGSGAADPGRPVHAWLIRQGFTLEQCERLSTLALGDHDALRARAATFEADAAAHSGPEYDLVGWRGPTPARHVDDLAVLFTRMSTDVPMGEMEFEEQVWDAARLAELEAREAAMGNEVVITAARHVPSDTLVGFTRLVWPLERPAGVWQEETLVRADHRGRRLGMRIKAANLARLVDANPDAARVHTWNASENDHMLAINDALGFEPQGLENAWRKRW